MKTTLLKFAAALLLFITALSPCRAQTNPPIEANSNNAPTASIIPTPEDLLAEKKVELEYQQASERLGAEKEMAAKRYDAERAMVHDIAIFSWVIIPVAIYFFCFLRDKQRQETIRLMIEKGTPMTPELLEGLRKKRSPRPAYDPRGYLFWGILLTLVGTAMMIVCTWGAGRSAAWIVLAVGAAHLILWFVDRIFSSGSQAK